MPYRVPDGILDHTHTWINENDRVSYERAFANGDLAAKRCAQAILSADPATPEAVITEQMTAPLYTPTKAPGVPVTIADIFGGRLPDPDVYNNAPTDYSGGPAGYSGSERNVSSWY